MSADDDYDFAEGLALYWDEWENRRLEDERAISEIFLDQERDE